jgi:hypothetical protein
MNNLTKRLLISYKTGDEIVYRRPLGDSSYTYLTGIIVGIGKTFIIFMPYSKQTLTFSEVLMETRSYWNKNEMNIPKTIIDEFYTRADLLLPHMNTALDCFKYCTNY